MKYFESQTFPRTTGQIARNIRINWDSANSYLRKLKDKKNFAKQNFCAQLEGIPSNSGEGILYHEKVGRQNQWCLMEYYIPWKNKLKEKVVNKR